jgi:hypothetical protein
MICNQKPKQRRGRYRKTYCPCLEEHACKNLEWLKTHGLWPSDLDSISEAMNRAENLPKVIAKNRVCSYRAVKFTMEEHGIDENGVERWARIQNARLGLCLPCIRAGKMSPAYCYIKH